MTDDATLEWLRATLPDLREHGSFLGDTRVDVRRGTSSIHAPGCTLTKGLARRRVTLTELVGTRLQGCHCFSSILLARHPLSAWKEALEARAVLTRVEALEAHQLDVSTLLELERAELILGSLPLLLVKGTHLAALARRVLEQRLPQVLVRARVMAELDAAHGAPERELFVLECSNGTVAEAVLHLFEVRPGYYHGPAGLRELMVVRSSVVLDEDEDRSVIETACVLHQDRGGDAPFGEVIELARALERS